MSARRVFVFMVALLSVIFGTSIRESGENLSKQAECLRACSLASKTGVKVSSVLSCYHCLNRRKSKQWQQEKMKDRLSFSAKTFTKRQRRSLLLDPSLPTSSTALKPSDCVGRTEDNSVPEAATPSKVDVTFGQYENTSYWYVNVSWTPINDSSGHLYGILLRLVLPYSSAVNCAVLQKNQTFLNINISFYGYSYSEPIYLTILGLPYRNIDIQMDTFYPSIPTSSTLTNTTGLPTSSTLTNKTGLPTSSTVRKTTTSNRGGLNSSSTTTPATTSLDTSVSTTTNKKSSTTAFLTSVKIGTEEGANHTIKYVSIATASGILVGLLLVLGFLKCMLLYIRRRKRPSPVPSGFDYHAFIIYNKEDSYWVKNRLLRLLEGKHHLKCCVHYRDFQPGSVFYDSMAESVSKSFKIIAVYSRNFLRSHFCTYELELAKYRLLTQRDNCLVVIRIDGTNCESLPRGLRERSVIDYFSTLERPLWMVRLLRFLDVPEDSDNQNAVTGQERNTNNRRDSRTGRRIRSSFMRLNSTSSSDTTVSFV